MKTFLRAVSEELCQTDGLCKKNIGILIGVTKD